MDQHVSNPREDQDHLARPTARTYPVRRRVRLRPLLLAGAAVAVVLLGAWYGHYYWTTGRFLISTDDAYLQADNVIVSPKVAGYLSQVLVRDNQPVHAGQVLARIDDRDYRTALDVAQANVAAEQAAIDNLGQQIERQKLTIAEAQATVEADKAALAFANLDSRRYASLSRSGAATTQEAQRASTEIQEKQAILNHDIAAVGAAQKQIDVLGTDLIQAKAVLMQRQGSLHQAQLNVGYTTITAPMDGTVGARTLRVGQYVQAGTQLMAIVPLQAVYVTANYKETQLTDVHPGQPVTIDVDTFPDQAVHGTVDSIAPASGQEFALLPPDNATGNFTKIVQRVPVKITIDPKDPLIGRLRPGMSVEPTIDTIDTKH
ncbi:MAG TPA: HlyD family secretion protein [Rhodopila sp.]|nr:HlyD family secretion protein [Rhodopila sp.]